MKKKLIYKYKEITKLIPVNNIIFKKNYTGFTFRKHLIIHGYKRFFFFDYCMHVFKSTYENNYYDEK